MYFVQRQMAWAYFILCTFTFKISNIKFSFQGQPCLCLSNVSQSNTLKKPDIIAKPIKANIIDRLLRRTNQTWLKDILIILVFTSIAISCEES